MNWNVDLYSILCIHHDTDLSFHQFYQYDNLHTKYCSTIRNLRYPLTDNDPDIFRLALFHPGRPADL